MTQQTFAELEYTQKKRKTRREKFLERMDKLIPWKILEYRIGKHYGQSKNGRPPYPLSVMLRIHCMQLFYNLSDPLMEDSLYEIESMRRFAGLRLSDTLPDETTILNFRHLLEQHQLGEVLFKEINLHLKSQGLLLKEGTIVDATIIEAPASTKNEEGKRDPEMHQTKKGNQWHFGMKLHIGVDDTTGIIHSAQSTAANIHDITVAEELLHGAEQVVYGDAGYTGIEKREEHQQRTIEWNIALKPGKTKVSGKLTRRIERLKSQVRAKVEHPFRYIKCVFGYRKVRYRGLAKNHQRLCLLLGFTNLLIGERYGVI